jgi:hypothetical protein
MALRAPIAVERRAETYAAFRSHVAAHRIHFFEANAPLLAREQTGRESPAKHATFAAARADDESGLIGCGVAGAPAPAAPGRGPGSVAPLLVTACPTVWVGSLEPGSLPPTSGPCEHPSSPDTFSRVLLRIHCSCRPMGDPRGPTRCDDFPLALRPPALTRVLRNQRM